MVQMQMGVCVRNQLVVMLGRHQAGDAVSARDIDNLVNVLHSLFVGT